MVFPYNLLLKSWEGSLKLHALVCLDENCGTQPIFHQNLLLIDSLGLLQAYLPRVLAQCEMPGAGAGSKPTPGSS